MSLDLKLSQVYVANPVTTPGPTDLLYIDVGGTTDGAIKYSDLSANIIGTILFSADTGSAFNAPNVKITSNSICGGSVHFDASTPKIILNVTDSNNCTSIGLNAAAGNQLSTSYGYQCLQNNNLGQYNAFAGANAGTDFANSYTTAMGYAALNQGAGDYNAVFGYDAGLNYSTLNAESSNILIMHLGVSLDQHCIRIGTQGTGIAQQNQIFLAGITGTAPIGANLPQVTLTDNAGQLSVISSLTSGYVLTSNGADTPTFQALPSTSPLTTKGDLYTYSSTNARLAIGSTNGQILQVASGATTGNAWSTATYPTTVSANALLYASSSNTIVGLGIGAPAQVLTVSGGGAPVWAALPSSAVTFTGDNGTPFSGSAVTIYANNTANACGISVLFNASTPNVTLQVTDSAGNLATTFPNTFIGKLSGKSGYSCTDTTGVGYSSCANITSGSFNTGFGNFSLYGATVDDKNTAVGWSAGNTGNAHITQCSFFGYQAGNNYLGTRIIGIGVGACSASGGGTDVIAIGHLAGSYLGAVNNTIVIQTDSGSELNLSNSIQIGNGNHTSCYVQGIYGVSPASPQLVIIDSAGQLGSVSESGFASTLAGDTGSTAISGGTITVNANNQCGTSVLFNASAGAVTLQLTDGTSNNTCLGNLSGHTGQYNTSAGYNSLGTTTRNNNCAFGAFALNGANTTGSTVMGYSALLASFSGDYATAFGFQALTSGCGSYVTALGYSAGSAYSTGGAEASNVVIAHTGIALDQNTIRIGTQGSGNAQQNLCYIAGIEGAALTAGSPSVGAVIIDVSNGQLITANSGISTSGHVLTSTGSASAPTWQAISSASSTITGIYYVAIGGNDSTGTGSISAPYATVDKAMAVIKLLSTATSYVINVGPGTFSRAVNLNILPNVVINGSGCPGAGKAGTTIIYTNIQLDSTWTAFSFGNCILQNCQIEATANITLTQNGGSQSVSIFNCIVYANAGTNTITMTGGSASGAVFLIDSYFYSPVLIDSIPVAYSTGNSYFAGLTLEATLVAIPTVWQGQGDYISGLTMTSTPANVVGTFIGSYNTTAALTNSTCSAYFDVASYPQGLITLTSSATYTVGQLPVTALNSGTSASSTTFWRGDGTWASIPGSNAWVDQTGSSVTMTTNTGYTADKSTLVTFTLPTTSSMGDFVEIIGKGSGGWSLIEGSGQTIYISPAAATTTTGSISSTNRYDCVRLRCITANTDWTVVSVQSAGLTRV